MDIEFELDKLEPLDVIDILGEIKISDESGNSIKDDCVCFGSFYYALSQTLILLKNDGSYEVDTIDEP